MDFRNSQVRTVPIKKTNAKDVNQLFKYVVEIGFGTYRYPTFFVSRVYNAFSKSDSSIYDLKKLS